MSRTSMSALALVLIGMAVAVGMRHAGPAGVQVHFSAAAAAESSLPCPAADVRLAAPIRIDPPAAGWDGRPVAVVATGALRAARFGHGARSVCSDYRNAQSVDTRF